jgi:hypothetical protein
MKQNWSLFDHFAESHLLIEERTIDSAKEHICYSTVYVIRQRYSRAWRFNEDDY